MDDTDGAFEGLSGYMADIFLALVAVVFFFLLLVEDRPATTSTGNSGTLVEVLNDRLVINGTSPFVVTAGVDGLHLEETPKVRVALPAIVADSVLASRLTQAVHEQQPVLLVIEPEGQEAAFLFMAAASAVKLPHVHQLRVDRQCRYIRDERFAFLCPSGLKGMPG